jgi:hypothetical protein
MACVYAWESNEMISAQGTEGERTSAQGTRIK